MVFLPPVTFRNVQIAEMICKADIHIPLCYLFMNAPARKKRDNNGMSKNMHSRYPLAVRNLCIYEIILP